MPTIAERLADWAASLRFEDLPPAVVHEVKRHVLDSLGCALGAWLADPCVIARRVAMRLSANPGAMLLGTKHIAPPDWAAFSNGCMVRYLDYNDTYLSLEPAHPSDNIPAALAVAQAHKANGKALIVAIALAYEIQCRLCDAASIRARGWDHVTYGAFSVALAAGKLMGLSADQLRHAVGIAGVGSANLRQSRVGELSHWKGCAFASAAQHGVQAAMLAAEGMTGPAPIFEGQHGFEKLVSGPLHLGGPFAEEPGNHSSGDFMIMRTSIKYWPAEYHSQSAIEAALELRREITDIEAIEAVSIESHDAAVDIIGSGAERWRPTSRETADHSLPYIVAVALIDGEITASQFEESRFTEPKLLNLLSRVSVTRNAELSQRYPKEVGNIVKVKLRDGRTLEHRVDTPLGNAARPLSDAQLQAKYLSQADAVLDAERANLLAQWVMRLEQQQSIDELFSLAEVR